MLKAGYGPLFHKVWCSKHAPSTGRQRDEKRSPPSSRPCGLIESRIIKYTSCSKARLSVHISGVSQLSLSVTRYAEGHTTPRALGGKHTFGSRFTDELS